jgi:hypothetical protein
MHDVTQDLDVWFSTRFLYASQLCWLLVVLQCNHLEGGCFNLVHCSVHSQHVDCVLEIDCLG